MAARKTAGARGAGEPETPGFEQALERLETIVDELEGGELTLEESLARYEEGMKLSRRLTQQLDEAEKRIERLVDAPDGGAVTQPMELDLKPAEDPGGEGELPF
jgi:exodeoxyribonuclease VII small subunit